MRDTHSRLGVVRDHPPGPVLPGQSAPGITYRNAEHDDMAAEHAVFVAAQGGLLQRHGFGWTTTPPFERHALTYRHLLEHDRPHNFVAERDGRMVGWSAVIVRDETAYLAAMFVEPGSQGMGIGRELFVRSFAGAPTRRMTTTDAIQPVSNALYARNGLLPATPILAFGGRASRVEPSNLEPSAPEDEALATLDRAAYGFDRAADHGFWTKVAKPTLWRRDGEPVAYSYRWPSGRVGPVAGSNESDAAAALWAELERDPGLRVEIPGSSRALVRVALSAGLQLIPPLSLLLMSDGIEPPKSLAIASCRLM